MILSDLKIKQILFFLILFIPGCSWDGVVYLSKNTDSTIDSDSLKSTDTDWTDTGGKDETDSNWSEEEKESDDDGTDVAVIIDTDDESTNKIIVALIYLKFDIEFMPVEICAFLSPQKVWDGTPAKERFCSFSPVLEPYSPYKIYIPWPAIEAKDKPFYVKAVLFLKGGGSGSTFPVAGIDYAGSSVSSFVFDQIDNNVLVVSILLKPYTNG
jgi:hypothetical protein